MVLQISANTGKVDYNGNLGLLEKRSRANATQLEDLRGVDGSSGEDDLFPSSDDPLTTPFPINFALPLAFALVCFRPARGDLHTFCCLALEHNLFDPGSGEQVVIVPVKAVIVSASRI